MALDNARAVIPGAAVQDAATYKYSPALIVDGWLHVSGQIGVSADGSVPTSPEEQARLAFESLGTVLNEAGADFSDIVSLTTYHVGDVASNPDWFNPVKDSFIMGSPHPTWTSVGVTNLAIPGAVLEISAVARVP